MTGILLITHNGLGECLIDCVRHVLGRVPGNLRALPVLSGDDPAKTQEQGQRLIAELDAGEGVLLLTDLYGATPCNIAQRLYVPGRVEGVTGVNLPMLLRAVNYSARPLDELVRKSLESGRGSVFLINSDDECDAETGSVDY